MWNLSPPGWRPLAKWTAIVTATAAAVLAVFIISGVYNVAASSDHFGITNRVIKLVLRRSIATRSLFVGEPPDLANSDLIRLGAGHYGGGCQPCHGSPGQLANPIVTEMLPAPPSLQGRVEAWSDKELFWIVKNGLKFTGMPAWTAQERDDEVWAAAAFLRQLPDMTPEEYVRLARGHAPSPEPAATTSDLASLTKCARCHGTQGAPPTSALVPRLAGQSQAYLERALREFATGARPSGIMHPVAFELDRGEIRDFAAYFAAMPASSTRPAEEAHQANLQQGREIAERGVPAEGIPACVTCHTGRTGSFPLLPGQSAEYLAGQLALWRKGGRDETTHGAIMAPIARRLSERQSSDVAAYFASLTPAATTGRSTGGEAAR